MHENRDESYSFFTSPPLYHTQTPDGIFLSFDGKLSFKAVILGGTQPYSWQEIIPAAAGGNAPASPGRSGTTTVMPAYELNGGTSVPAGTVVDMWEWWNDTSGTTGQNYAFKHVVPISTGVDFIMASASSHFYSLAGNGASQVIGWANIAAPSPSNWSLANDFGFGPNTSVKYNSSGPGQILGLGVSVAVKAAPFTTGYLRLIINYVDSIGVPTWTNLAGAVAYVDSQAPYVFLNAYGEIPHAAGHNAAFYAAVTNYTTGTVTLDSDDSSGTPPAPNVTQFGIRAFGKVVA